MNPTILVEGIHGHGAIVDTPDPRDFKYEGIAKSSAPFDWNTGYDVELDGKITIKDQGGSFSCGGQAWSYFMGVLKGDSRSAKFIYAQTAVPGGGSSGRSNSDLVVNQGDCQESILSSYEGGLPPSEAYISNGSDIGAKAKADALTDEAFSYGNPSINIDSLTQALRDNKGCIIGVYGQNNGTWTSAFPQPPLSNDWAHWLYIGKAKLINGKKYLGACNSWGDKVGEAGWQWLGEEYIPHLFSAWTLYCKATDFIFKTNMMFGQTSDDIVQLQRRLGVNPTGFYGPLTRTAVFAYQLKNVPMTSIEKYVYKGLYCGEKTRAALNQG